MATKHRTVHPSRSQSNSRPESNRRHNYQFLLDLPDTVCWEQIAYEADLGEWGAVALAHKAGGYSFEHAISEQSDADQEPLRAAWRKMERLLRSGRIKRIFAHLPVSKQPEGSEGIYTATAKEDVAMPEAVVTRFEEPEFVRSSIVSEIASHLENDIPPEAIGWTKASTLREIADGKDKNDSYELYDSDFVPELIVSFTWWVGTAECFLPSPEDCYLDPATLPLRDRLIELEGNFWEAVAPARRRTVVYLESVKDHTDEPGKELIRRYMAYRDAVCGQARQALPASFCERLERRV